MYNYSFQNFTVVEVRLNIQGYFLLNKGAHAARVTKMDLNNTRRRKDSNGRTYQTIKAAAIVDGVRRVFVAFWDCETGRVFGTASA